MGGGLGWQRWTGQLSGYIPFRRVPLAAHPVEPEEVVKVRVDLLPLHVGLSKLVVNFESDKLKSVKGFRNIIIGPS